MTEIVWTDEARRRVDRAPPFIRPGILKLMPIRARERGRTVITSDFLTEIRNESMLRVAKCIKGFGFEELSMAAFEVAKAKMRKLPHKVEVIGEIEAFLDTRVEKNEMILAKFRRYLQTIPERGLPWTEEALARVQRAPAFVQGIARTAIEEEARRRKEPVVTPEAVEHVMGLVPMAEAPAPTDEPRSAEPLHGVTMLWEAAAEERLRRIPIPAVRAGVIRKVEAHARAQGLGVVDLAAYGAAIAGGLPRLSA
ncbi:MAG: PCP reductase family protein [Candidatus Rokubacteria bacterium]|nr:PCP reductase family protein [Candidatus Rokubacteria bacterium]MBI3108147.1 PCP reductase family protein [Candidatus Rokubacteria bacterium]